MVMQSSTEKEWRAYAQRTLKREMGHALIKSNELANQLGVKPDTLAKRIKHGAFTAGFFLQALEALGVEQINLKDIKKKEAGIKL